MRSAHRSQTVAVGEEPGDARIYGALVLTLVFDDLPGDKVTGFKDQPRRIVGLSLIEGVRNFPQAI